MRALERSRARRAARVRAQRIDAVSRFIGSFLEAGIYTCGILVVALVPFTAYTAHMGGFL